MDTKIFTPEVNAANEFLEIANDFTNPLELIREAISNSFDANATEIKLIFEVIDDFGDDLFKITINDNGDGMEEKDFKHFFDLGNSSRRGEKNTIGEKGHGTKVYFNSKRLVVKTNKENRSLEAEMKDIFRTLNQGQLPTYSITTVKEDAFKKGTQIEVYGYNQSKYSVFTHDILKDFIFWKTKFGSIEQEFGIGQNSEVKLYLKGLDAEELEELKFGHFFPTENKNVDKLFEEYSNDAPHHFCKKWIKEGHLPNFPHIKFQAVFYVEGKYVKYSYNKMLRRQGYNAPQGSYKIQDRYGVWLCKDFIPIQSKNVWVTNKGSEYTKFHAFFNCQNFKLTANRGSIENTTPEIYKDIEETVKKIYNEVTESDDYATLDWLQQESKGYITQNREQKDFDRRKKQALKQNIAIYKEIEK